jgi:AcrR family transcriptional regulator
MRTKSSQSNTREKIIDIAADLFYERGIYAVGVDEIVAQAGIAKMTLYNYFISKDQLVLAVLQRNEDRWWGWFDSAIKRLGKSPKKRLIAIFDAIEEWFEEDAYKGSPFVNARIQVSNSMYPIYFSTDEFRQRLREYIVDLGDMAELDNSQQLADQFLILIIGANVLAVIENPERRKNAIKLAKRMAVLLLEESV